MISSVAAIKLESINNSVLVLFNSIGEVCPIIDLLDTSLFPFRSVTPTPSRVSVNIHKSPYNPLYLRLPSRGTPSQRPHLHTLSSSSSLSIVDALKLAKSVKRSKYDIVTIDFYNINMHEVKYLPPSFDGDVMFALQHYIHS